MLAAGPQTTQELIPFELGLNELIESQHSNLYKRKEIRYLVITISCFFISLILLEHGLFGLSRDWGINVLEMFTSTIVLSLVLHLVIFLANKHHNQIVDDVIKNSNLVILQKPRWIKEIGFVDKLHPSHLKKGTEIEIATQEVKVDGIYFLHNRKCFKHENKQGVDRHYYAEQGSSDSHYHEVVSYYYFQIANFKIQNKELELKSMDYTPAFDTSIIYNIIFQVTKFDEEMIYGKCLKVFLPDNARQVYPEEWVGQVPDTSQRMIKIFKRRREHDL
jgi:hypothetical protein